MDLGILTTILDPIIGAGPLFMIFIVFTVIGLIVRLGPLRAIRNGLMIAVGFQGVYIVVDFFLGSVAPAAEQLALRFGGVFTYTDIGWSAFASFAFASPLAYAIIGLSLLVNLVMIFTKMTDTLNLNIWDFWEAIIATLMVQALTGNVVAGLVFGTFLAWFNLMMSDFNAQRGYCADLGFEGLSFYQGTNVAWGAFGHYVGKLLDKTGLEAKITPDYIQEKFGVIGEPAVLGGIIGLLMGIGAGFYWTDIVLLMIALATSLVLIPMMSGIVMQALVPVSEAAGSFMKKSSSGKQLFIGVDPAIAVGNTTVLATTVLMVPILLLMAFIIPGAVNHPLADLPSLLFFWVFVVAPNKFDLIRTLITTTLMGIYGTIASIIGVSRWSSLVAENSGVEVAAGTGVTSWFNHLCPEMLVAGLLGENYNRIGGMVGIIGFCVVVVLITIAYRLRYLKRMGNEAAAQPA
jgi:PTS system galactitol-specific IIC component